MTDSIREAWFFIGYTLLIFAAGVYLGKGWQNADQRIAGQAIEQPGSDIPAWQVISSKNARPTPQQLILQIDTDDFAAMQQQHRQQIAASDAGYEAQLLSFSEQFADIRLEQLDCQQNSCLVTLQAKSNDAWLRFYRSLGRQDWWESAAYLESRDERSLTPYHLVLLKLDQDIHQAIAQNEAPRGLIR